MKSIDWVDAKLIRLRAAAFGETFSLRFPALGFANRSVCLRGGGHVLFNRITFNLCEKTQNVGGLSEVGNECSAEKSSKWFGETLLASSNSTKSRVHRDP